MIPASHISSVIPLGLLPSPRSASQSAVRPEWCAFRENRDGYVFAHQVQPFSDGEITFDRDMIKHKKSGWWAVVHCCRLMRQIVEERGVVIFWKDAFHGQQHELGAPHVWLRNLILIFFKDIYNSLVNVRGFLVPSVYSSLRCN